MFLKKILKLKLKISYNFNTLTLILCLIQQGFYEWVAFMYIGEHVKCISCVFNLCIYRDALTCGQTELKQDPLCFSFPLPSLFRFVGVEWRPPVCFDIPHSLLKLRVRLCEEWALECLCYDVHSTRPLSERPVKWVQGPECPADCACVPVTDVRRL